MSECLVSRIASNSGTKDIGAEFLNSAKTG